MLGSASCAPRGKGFGTSKPRTIYDGGVPSGLVASIHWRNWGAVQACRRRPGGKLGRWFSWAGASTVC